MKPIASIAAITRPGLIVAVALGTAIPSHAQTFLPDETVVSLVVTLTTADVFGAGTDSEVDFSVSPNRKWDLDTPFPYDDFERNQTQNYTLNAPGMTVEDIRYIRIHKSPGNGVAGLNKWKLAKIVVTVNDKTLYANEEINRWFEGDGVDPRLVWMAADWTPLERPLLAVTTPALPGASVDAEYSASVAATGGKPPYTWTSSVLDNPQAWRSGPTVTALNTTQGQVTGRSAALTASVVSRLRLTVTDTRGMTASHDLPVSFIYSLPSPAITSFTPVTSWRSGPLSLPGGQVTVEGTNFDPRPGKTTIRFNGQVGTIDWLDATRIAAHVPAGATTGRITVATDFGTATSPRNLNVSPYAYRPINGFSFPNFATPDLSWDLFRDLFGSAQVEFGPVAKPTAALFYSLIFRKVASTGNCHGFSLASLRFQQGALQLSRFPPFVADTIYGLNRSTPLIRRIHLNQGAQLGLEALEYFAGNLVLNRTGFWRQTLPDTVPVSLANSNPLMFSISRDLSTGHTIIPYAVEDAGGLSQVRIYDPNKPYLNNEMDDDGSFVTIDRSNGGWSYPFDSTDIWSGPWLMAVPYSAYPDVPILITEPTRLNLLFVLFGAARAAQLSDDEGRTFYTPLGEFNRAANAFDGVLRVVPLGATEGGYPDTYFLAADPKRNASAPFTADVAGKGTGGRSIAAFLTGGAAWAIGNLSVEPGRNDRIRFDAAAGRMEYTGASDQRNLWIDYIRRVPGDAARTERTYSLARLNVGAGQPVTLDDDPLGSDLRLRNGGNRPLKFDLLVETARPGGVERQIVGSFSIEPGEVHRFTLPMDGPSVLSIDTNGDGKEDRREDLSPTPLVPFGRLGDVNGDGQLTASDAGRALRFLLSREIPDAGQLARGDVAPRPGTGDRPVGDGRIALDDVIVILRTVVGLDAPMGTTMGIWERPAIFPRLPDPLPPSPVESIFPIQRDDPGELIPIDLKPG